MQPPVGKNILLVLVVWSKIQWRLWKDSDLVGSWLRSLFQGFVLWPFFRNSKIGNQPLHHLPLSAKEKEPNLDTKSTQTDELSWISKYRILFSSCACSTGPACSIHWEFPHFESCTVHTGTAPCVLQVWGYLCTFVWYSRNWDFEWRPVLPVFSTWHVCVMLTVTSGISNGNFTHALISFFIF